MIWHAVALRKYSHELLWNFVDQSEQTREIANVTEFGLLAEIMREYGLPGLAICLSIYSLYRAAHFLKPIINALSERLLALLTRLIAEIERSEKHREQLLKVLTNHQEGIQELLELVRHRRRHIDNRDREREDDGD